MTHFVAHALFNSHLSKIPPFGLSSQLKSATIQTVNFQKFPCAMLAEDRMWCTLNELIIATRNRHAVCCVRWTDKIRRWIIALVAVLSNVVMFSNRFVSWRGWSAGCQRAGSQPGAWRLCWWLPPRSGDLVILTYVYCAADSELKQPVCCLIVTVGIWPMSSLIFKLVFFLLRIWGLAFFQKGLCKHSDAVVT